jgi:hypothetical protein
MFSKKELIKLSKNELIDIIFKQEERLEKIEKYLKFFKKPHTPSSKKNTEKIINEKDDEVYLQKQKLFFKQELQEQVII